MASVTQWVKSIVFVVMFAAFLEILLPNNSMQRFVRVITGLFIMLTILNPIIDLIDSGINIRQIPALSSQADSMDGAVSHAVNYASQKRELIAREMYSKDLAKQIRATVLAVAGVADAKIEVILQEEIESQKTALIQQVIVYIQPGIMAADRKVTKVAIGNQDLSEIGNRALSDQVKDKVRHTIAELYQLRQEQIDIRQMN
ncbi:stage III sporulation protein AF [Methylomusa anaerophila]|uniref:Stage III sporulation protein AF n=2 Tax=Methylomusa anaerophila TaxID=1930071 RepID=A0A348APB3_9FIRM|nr:stage III sporulation protein AF [Methylomusa anaerophila]BBB92911.1 Stage III sporulation protein AF [Methylomusa anaerophila]